MKLRVVEGKRRGKEFSIGTEPVTIGRDSRCAIVLPDDQLVSTEHAELRMGTEDQLFICDLESVNGTEVNGEAIQEKALSPGDQITIGSTVFEVIEESAPLRVPPPRPSPPRSESKRLTPPPKKREEAPEPEQEEEEEEPEKPKEKEKKKPEKEREKEKKAPKQEVEEEESEESDESDDEGLTAEEKEEKALKFARDKKKRQTQETPAASPAQRVVSLVLTAFIVVVIVVGGLIVWQSGGRNMLAKYGWLMPQKFESGNTSGSRLELSYEKVQASKQNIFRYAMTVSGGKLIVNIDDLKQNRHVQKEKKISEQFVRDLMGRMELAGFEKLDRPKFGGLAAGDQQETAMIETTRGSRVKRVEVENTIAPECFVAVQKDLEETVQAELGLLAVTRSQEQLVKEADEAFLNGKQLYDQRDVDYPNLFKSIIYFKTVQNDLEVIEPKPAKFATAVQLEAAAQEKLKEIVDNLKFNADKSKRLGEWAKAADYYKEIMLRVPDRERTEYKEADVQLIIAQSHLQHR